jgi:hypothetical protein
VKQLHEALVQAWAFKPGDIVTLAGWEVAEAARPTRANIVAAFEKMIEQTRSGDLVVLYLASHCTQLLTPPEGEAIDPVKDPTRAAAPASARTAERDKYDEVFMPADAGAMDWENRKLDRGIFDHEFARWVQALRDRGAFVFAIVNTPHAAGLLDCTPEMLLKSPSRADTPKALAGLTGFVALYACYADESDAAMEAPAGAAGAATQPGALPGALCAALRGADAQGWSYRDLTAAIVEMYRKEGRRKPVPASEGDLEARLLRRPEGR